MGHKVVSKHCDFVREVIMGVSSLLEHDKLSWNVIARQFCSFLVEQLEGSFAADI